MNNILIPKEYFLHSFTSHLNELMNKIHVGAFPDGGQHFHLSELGVKELSHIPKNEISMFLSALACTTLYDQFMFSHFRRYYGKKNMAMCLKITSSYSNCTNIIPWELLNISKESKNDTKNIFSEFTEYYVQYMKEKVENEYPSISWNNISRIARNDKDVNNTVYGKIFINEIEKVAL